jgi:hypothetical protein
MPPHKKMTLAERLAQVDEFAILMKQRIEEEERAGRDEWDTWTVAQLLPRVAECMSEVFTAVSGGLSPDEFARSCANLANYCMIVSHLALSRGLEDTKSMQAPYRMA